ncbi:hypothetical protein Ga0466249_003776 [Sporomusaceae bacterium BoRhaA]|nr:hypothetical protein [Pelorhabdus rhamnosifermentans]
MKRYNEKSDFSTLKKIGMSDAKKAKLSLAMDRWNFFAAEFGCWL